MFYGGIRRPAGRVRFGFFHREFRVPPPFTNATGRCGFNNRRTTTPHGLRLYKSWASFQVFVLFRSAKSVPKSTEDSFLIADLKRQNIPYTIIIYRRCIHKMLSSRIPNNYIHDTFIRRYSATLLRLQTREITRKFMRIFIVFSIRERRTR